MSEEKWKKDSLGFDATSAIYDMYRPSYPQIIIDELIESTQVNASSSLLEIGAGSGKATELFLPLNCHITCVEPGEDLARLGLAKLNVEGNITYKVGRFEDIDLFDRTYDLIFSAQAFHWVERPMGYDKIEKLLKHDAYLALIWNMYVNTGDGQHEALSKLCRDYQVMFFQDKDGLESMKSSWVNELLDCGYFKTPLVIEVPWTEEQSLENYMNFLNTSSSYLRLNKEEKRIFDSEVQRIFEQSDNIITRTYNCTVYLAQKK